VKEPLRFVAAVAVAAVLAGAAAVALAHTTRDLDEGFTSVALNGRVHARVVLPPGYDTSGKRYPVVYFLHGLPANSASYRGNSWVVDALGDAGPAILVIPQGARDNDTDPEYLNWGAGRNWETYIATELPAYIDAHFRTIRSRAGRAIVGVSAGGYGATILGLHHPDRYSVIESWSGYFHPTDPTGTQPLDLGPATSAHNLISVLRSHPVFFAFYVGRGDGRFRAENVQLNQELGAAHVAHVFTTYPGGHTTSLWSAHAVVWLRMALAHLAKPKA